MSAHLRRARRFLQYEGVPAQAAAAAAGVSVGELRNGRRALGRDPELGSPDLGAPRSERGDESFSLFDSMMRSNRGVGL